MLTAERLLDDPTLPLRDPLQSPTLAGEFLDRHALGALYPDRELGEVAVLSFAYTPGRKCVGLYAVRLRGDPPGGPRWAAMTHARDDRLERVHTTGRRGGAPCAVYVSEHRCLVEPFPTDSDLPTLARALDAAAVALRADDRAPARADGNLRPPSAVEVLRHCPHEKCVLRYDGLFAPAVDVIGKVYPSAAKALDVGRKLATLHAPAAARGFRVPRKFDVLADWNLLLMEALRGRSVKRVLQSDTPAEAERAARAAARALAGLHGLHMASDERRSLTTELDRVRKRTMRLPPVAPLLADEVDRVMRRLAAPLLACADERTCLIHADYKPSQLLVEDDRVGMVDFYRACLGDPALDVGRFMAQCRKEAVLVGRDELRATA